MSKVSFVIPYWKGPLYLTECIETIHQQDFTDYEIVVVKDLAGDEVPEEVTGDSKVSVYEAWPKSDEELEEERKEEAEEEKPGKGEGGPSEEFDGEPEPELEEDTEVKIHSRGVGFCRNVGLSHAEGEYVYFIDCDDYLPDPASIGSMVSLADEKKLDVVMGNVWRSWFSPRNYEANIEKLTKETEWDKPEPLSDETLREKLRLRFSVHNMLIRRDFLVKEEITFPEASRHHSDMWFVLRVLDYARNNCYTTGSIYVSRKRNDKVNLPALSQKERHACARDYVKQYRNCMEFIGDRDPVLKEMLERYCVDFTLTRFSRIIYGNKLTRQYSSELMKMENFKEYKKKYSGPNRLKISFIRKSKFRLAKKAAKLNSFVSKKKGFFGSKIQWYRFIEKHIFKKMSLRTDWVLFESFFGKSYSDSPKYLYEYLQRTRGDKYKYIWVVNHESEELKQSGKHKVCKMNSLRYMYYLSRCGYRIFNVRQPVWSKKRPGVVFLETWHGTPLKKLAMDLEDSYAANPHIKTVFYTQGKEWNHLISANPFSTEVFARAFGYDKEKILEYGYPRNDILYAPDKDQIAADVKKEFGIPEGKRVILYAPTWRDDQAYKPGAYQFTLALDLDRMRKEFGDNSVVLLRTHYYIADMLDMSGYEGFVFNGSQYEDVSRLYLASDILITDYSSVFFDYANLRRPILFFAYDYDAYADEIRGLYINMEKELPGPILRTNDELVQALHDINEITERYSDRYEEFYNRFCCVDDGHASERTIEKLFGENQ